MKRIINRQTGKPLTAVEAETLYTILQSKVPSIKHQAPYGYPTPEIAEKATLQSIIESFEGYIFAFTGSAQTRIFDGYSSYVIAFKYLPKNFEEQFSIYTIVNC